MWHHPGQCPGGDQQPPRPPAISSRRPHRHQKVSPIIIRLTGLPCPPWQLNHAQVPVSSCQWALRGTENRKSQLSKHCQAASAWLCLMVIMKLRQLPCRVARAGLRRLVESPLSGVIR